MHSIFGRKELLDDVLFARFRGLLYNRTVSHPIRGPVRKLSTESAPFFALYCKGSANTAQFLRSVRVQVGVLCDGSGLAQGILARVKACAKTPESIPKMVDEQPLNLGESKDAICAPSSKNVSVSEGTENFYTGSEPFFSFFTQAQVILSTIRLSLEHRVIVPTSDLCSQMEGARRGFQHSGNLIVVVQDVGRIAAQFKQRAQQWEREIQNREQNKSGMSGALIQRLKAEATHVRGRIQGIDRALIKLEVMLHQMAGEAKD